MSDKGVEFSDKQVEELAKFLAELTRQGVAYIVRELIGGWKVEVTGF